MKRINSCTCQEVKQLKKSVAHQEKMVTQLIRMMSETNKKLRDLQRKRDFHRYVHEKEISRP